MASLVLTSQTDVPSSQVLEGFYGLQFTATDCYGYIGVVFVGGRGDHYLSLLGAYLHSESWRWFVESLSKFGEFFHASSYQVNVTGEAEIVGATPTNPHVTLEGLQSLGHYLFEENVEEAGG